MHYLTGFFISAILFFNPFTYNIFHDEMDQNTVDHVVVDSLISYSCQKVIAQLPDTGSLPLHVDDFVGIISNPSNCDLDDVQFSFCSFDMNDTILTLGCYDIGTTDHYTYMWLNGVKVDSCIQDITISDPTEVCDECERGIEDIEFECRGQFIEINDVSNVLNASDFVGNVIFPPGCGPIEFRVSFNATSPADNAIDFGCDKLGGGSVTVYFWVRKNLVTSCVADFIISDPAGLCGVVLADDFLAFGADVKPNGIDLSWQTPFDFEFDVLSVEHKSENGQFNELIRLAKHQDLNDKTYAFKHRSPNDGINYYRLEFLDASNGHLKYSNIVAITWNEGDDAFKIYPNPVTDGYFHIESKDKAQTQIQIFDQIGREVLNSIIHDDIKIVDLSDLAKGVYLIKIGEEVQSFIVK